MRADQEIVGLFSFLEEGQVFRCVRSEYNPVLFGNAIVEYRSPRLRIRVVKDRGQFLSDFAAPREPVEWFDQEIVFRDLGQDQTVDDLIAQRWSSLDAVAAAVKDISSVFANASEKRVILRAALGFKKASAAEGGNFSARSVDRSGAGRPVERWYAMQTN